jgi:disks large-associated protein 5
MLSHCVEHPETDARMRFELRALHSLFLEHPYVFVGIPDAIAGMPSPPTTDALRRTRALARIRGAPIRVARATVRTRKEALRVPFETLPVPRDALPVPRDAPPIPRDALLASRDALPIPRDALLASRDAPPIRRDAPRVLRDVPRVRRAPAASGSAPPPSIAAHSRPLRRV